MKNFILLTIIFSFLWIFYFVEYWEKTDDNTDTTPTSIWTNIQNSWSITEKWQVKYVIKKKSINELRKFLWMFFIDELSTFKEVIINENTLKIEKEYKKGEWGKEYRYLVDKMVLNNSNRIKEVVWWISKTSSIKMKDVGVEITIELFQWDWKTPRWTKDTFPYGDKIEITLESFEVTKFDE